MSAEQKSRPTTRRATSRPATFAGLVALLPDRVDGYVAQKPDRLCDARTIYGYMDGAAEVYLTYAFQGLVVRLYDSEGAPPIIVELFDMTRSFDAYGVFTNGRDESVPDAGIGQGSELRDDLLTFWQDRYFIAVRVDARDVPPAAKKALRRLGAAVTERIGKTGPLPQVLTYLPRRWLIDHSQRYFNGPDALNYHYDLGEGNPLNLSPAHQAVLASYRVDGVRCQVLCVLYDKADQASAASAALAANLTGREGAERRGDAIQRAPDRWAVVRARGRLLVATLETPTRDAATKLAEEATGRYDKNPRRTETKEQTR